MTVDVGLMVSKLFEFAPAVLILLYLNWRTDKTLAKVVDWCLGEISEDVETRKRVDNS